MKSAIHRLRSGVKQHSESLRIVSIGGGTGLSVLLRGLRRYSEQSGLALDITAVVTVTDDGGSSGRLRRDFGMLPPGDIRNCMLALCHEEALLTRLLQYRFRDGRGLKGHSLGNLFLTAMTELTGDFANAVRLSSEVLAACGKIYPSTISKVTLEAELGDCTRVRGETRISRSAAPIERILLRPPDVKPLPETLGAIATADLITLGPGSLFTSVIPNLLVDGIPEAIAGSRAGKVYFMNLMGQPGETSDLRASQHLAALTAHAGRGVVDTCVFNTRPISASVLERYRAQGANPVPLDRGEIRRHGVALVGEPLSLEGGPEEEIRHDPAALARVVVRLARRSRLGHRELAS